MKSLLFAIAVCLNLVSFAQPANSNSNGSASSSNGQSNQQAAPQPFQSQVDCSGLTPDMQQFSAQLSPANQKLFCGQFNDTQRVSSMEMANQQNVNGSMMMTPDQAVQKTAAANNMIQQKTPTGCPVK